MYRLEVTGQFKKDLKKVKKRAKDFELTRHLLLNLQSKGKDGVPPKMKPNQLIGNYKNHWECHIKPDLLIIWFQIENPKTIKLIRIGSHSDLFN
ncbi:type II toxin-antitoxin system YafQ family toxin [Psychroflexus planctonicus]|uniref:mRNA interferase YafQ n=1 Tax=Psychroflexus planctonicus TaxID=1526575 RepID=A0ABQ1SE94_9FLAO|nr:type II toxin-antitoxin system YafQ family toxin [Psychroflexus planctonicus]GGE25672.1 hypothetical protein GCM10010832_03060 [Psychroflexus planctonicus]